MLSKKVLLPEVIRDEGMECYDRDICIEELAREKAELSLYCRKEGIPSRRGGRVRVLVGSDGCNWRRMIAGVVGTECVPYLPRVEPFFSIQLKFRSRSGNQLLK